MRMLQWMCGVTKLDRLRNERIRGTTKVGEISKKVKERRLKWLDGEVISKRRESGRKSTTELHGGLYCPTSAPHKSWNKIKRNEGELTL